MAEIPKSQYCICTLHRHLFWFMVCIEIERIRLLRKEHFLGRKRTQSKIQKWKITTLVDLPLYVSVFLPIWLTQKSTCLTVVNKWMTLIFLSPIEIHFWGGRWEKTIIYQTCFTSRTFLMETFSTKRLSITCAVQAKSPGMSSCKRQIGWMQSNWR